MSNTGKGNVQIRTGPLVCDSGSIETTGKSGVTADVAEARMTLGHSTVLCETLGLTSGAR